MWASRPRRARASLSIDSFIRAHSRAPRVNRRARVTRETVTSTSTRVGERGEAPRREVTRRRVRARARDVRRGRIDGSIHGDDEDDDDDAEDPIARDDDRARWDARCVRSRCVRTVDDEDAGVVGGGVERIERRGRGVIRRRGHSSRGWTGVEGGAGKVARVAAFADAEDGVGGEFG